MSIKGKAVHLLLRHRHLLKGQFKREVIDQNTSIEKLRRDSNESAARMMKLAQDIIITSAAGSPVEAEWVRPSGADPRKAMLYFHGGGFVMGNALSHRGIVGNFAKACGYAALVFNYRLAPEFPAPAAVQDAVAIYAWMLAEGYLPEHIVFAGDSAGGGLALAALLKCKDDALPLPAACVAFSPCTDMTLSGESYRTRAKADPCTPKGMSETYLGYYVGTGDPKHPYASPLFGDLVGLPPIMLHVGNDEVLRDDTTRFAENARLSGVAVSCKVWKGMFHCFPLLAPLFPEATAAMQEVVGFVKERLNIVKAE